MNQFITKIFLNIFIHTTMWIKPTTSSNDFFCFEKMSCIRTTSPKINLNLFAAGIITCCWNIRPLSISTNHKKMIVRFQIITTSCSRKIFASWKSLIDISNRLLGIKKKENFFLMSTWCELAIIIISTSACNLSGKYLPVISFPKQHVVRDDFKSE